jgi:hypothetical protein
MATTVDNWNPNRPNAGDLRGTTAHCRDGHHCSVDRLTAARSPEQMLNQVGFLGTWVPPRNGDPAS